MAVATSDETALTSAVRPALPPAGAGYIAGPVRDFVFLYGAPIVGVLAFLPLYFIPWFSAPLPKGFLLPEGQPVRTVLIGALTYAHLFIVLFRSHGNPAIFAQFPLRFTLVPALLFIAMLSSLWILVICGVLAIWWDVYHSAMQTFGIGRIYDLKRGNNPQAGRTIDRWLNLAFYIGPILGGATLANHLAYCDEIFAGAGYPTTLAKDLPIPAQYLAWTATAIVLGIVAWSLWGYWRLMATGYVPSWQKLALVSIHAVVSVVCWGFNRFDEAFFVINFFHAWQYFFLVWHTEKKNIVGLFRQGNSAAGQAVALTGFVLIGCLYGLFAMIKPTHLGDMWMHGYLSFLTLISLMHFWYDGFIWSVRKKQVA